jgi:lysophospholipase L1-like esterase
MSNSFLNFLNIDKDMSKDDVIVVCAGSNDISKNNAKEGLRNIINFVRRDQSYQYYGYGSTTQT